MERRATFNEILNRTEEDNCARLMEKARVANRIAKTTRPRSRRKAYQVKAGALLAIIRKMSGKYSVKRDHRLFESHIVTLSTERSGLHIPSRELRLAA
jgi:hypothetical protein